MRALIFVAIAVVAAGVGYLLYRQSAATAPSSGMFAEAPPAELPTAEDCTVANAVYEYNEDPRLRLSFEPIPAAGDGVEILDERLRPPGNVNLIIQATSFQANYTFAPDNDFMASGPKHQTLATYFRPAAGGARIRVNMFDSTMHYISDMPRYDSVAPGYIYMPDVMGLLYGQRIDLPPGAFRFHSCESPTPAAAP
jgi:hypothetical protein